MECWSKNRVHGPVVAIWTAQPSGHRVPLCKPCLDGWLDNADDGPDLEPARLQWVFNLPWCIRHAWPARLCDDWPPATHPPFTIRRELIDPTYQPESKVVTLRDDRCCDLQNVHCEPPSELCCPQCTEADHPRHAIGPLDPGFSQEPPPPDTRLNLFSLSPRGAS